MKSLKDLKLQPKIIKGENKKEKFEFQRDNVYSAFFNKSKIWKANTGAFSSIFFDLYDEIILDFINNGGKMYIICENRLSPQDYSSISTAYELKKIYEKEANQEYENFIKTKNIDNQLSFIGQLIIENKLEIKVGIPKDGVGQQHAKDKIWIDENNDIAIQTGSSNLSLWGEYHSKERKLMYYSWKNDEPAIVHNDFETWWQNKDNDYEYFNLPKAIKDDLIQKSDRKKFDELKKEIKQFKENRRNHNDAQLTKEKLRWYQKEAIEAWQKDDNKGLLALATGAGKTFIGMFAAKLSLEKNESVLINVPSTDLQKQWVEEIKKWLPEYSNNILLIGGDSKFKLNIKKANIILNKNNIPNKGPYIIVAVYNSIRSKNKYNRYLWIELFSNLN